MQYLDGLKLEAYNGRVYYEKLTYKIIN